MSDSLWGCWTCQGERIIFVVKYRLCLSPMLIPTPLSQSISSKGNRTERMFCFFRWEGIDQAEKKNKTKNKTGEKAKAFKFQMHLGWIQKGSFSRHGFHLQVQNVKKKIWETEASTEYLTFAIRDRLAMMIENQLNDFQFNFKTRGNVLGGLIVRTAHHE